MAEILEQISVEQSCFIIRAKHQHWSAVWKLLSAKLLWIRALLKRKFSALNSFVSEKVSSKPALFSGIGNTGIGSFSQNRPNLPQKLKYTYNFAYLYFSIYLQKLWKARELPLFYLFLKNWSHVCKPVTQLVKCWFLTTEKQISSRLHEVSSFLDSE